VLNFISLAVVHYLFFEAFTLSIGEKEKLNKQLQQSVAEANKMAASRSNFLSTVSHELRTPLNSVVGIAELLMAENLEVKQKENMKILQYSALDLLSLINNVLDFNKLDSDKLVLESVSFCLAEFMERICLGLKAKAADKHLHFVLDIDAQLRNTFIVSDPTRLSQLIYNLVSNAIKFTEKGSIIVKLECISRNKDEVNVTFSVTDTGIGIHADKHEAIFELFTQAESNATRKFGGTGLGLAIVKQVLALFGSEIHLQSTHGIGTKFYFTIPFTTTTEHNIMEPATPAIAPDLSELKILIAEDHNFNRIIIRKQFEALDLQPTIVEDGMQAFEACQGDRYDAVFLDLHMPGLDGYETAKLIRQIPEPAKSHVYILAFTASVTEQQKILSSGFDGFLYKPLEMESLREKLELIAALPGTRRPVAAL
jgi:signal transduction histidine kinase/ActR/RegA family two-component response regulator